MNITKHVVVCLFGVSVAASSLATPARLAPYTDNPLVEFLSAQRYHTTLAVQVDTASNDHDLFTLIAGMGYYPMENLSVGLYGSIRSSDRRFPTRMRSMYGLGLFSEYNFSPATTLQPFGALRLGFLDTAGDKNPTSIHVAGIGGVKMVFNQNMAVSLAGVFNWTEEPLLNYTQSPNGSYSSSHADLGIEIGIRLGF